MSKREPPEICDFDCPFASFPPAETAGICRTMSAVLCGKLGEIVSKNRPCEWRRRATPTNVKAPKRPVGGGKRK